MDWLSCFSWMLSPEEQKFLEKLQDKTLKEVIKVDPKRGSAAKENKKKGKAATASASAAKAADDDDDVIGRA